MARNGRHRARRDASCRPGERWLPESPGVFAPWDRSQDPYLWILRPQSFDAFSDIPEVNIAAVNFHEVLKRSLAIAGRLVGAGEIVVERHALLIVGSNLQRSFVPLEAGVRDPLVNKALREPGVSLHGLRK